MFSCPNLDMNTMSVWFNPVSIHLHLSNVTSCLFNEHTLFMIEWAVYKVHTETHNIGKMLSLFS